MRNTFSMHSFVIYTWYVFSGRPFVPPNHHFAIRLHFVIDKNCISQFTAFSIKFHHIYSCFFYLKFKNSICSLLGHIINYPIAWFCVRYRLSIIAKSCLLIAIFYVIKKKKMSEQSNELHIRASCTLKYIYVIWKSDLRTNTLIVDSAKPKNVPAMAVQPVCRFFLWLLLLRALILHSW